MEYLNSRWLFYCHIQGILFGFALIFSLFLIGLLFINISKFKDGDIRFLSILNYESGIPILLFINIILLGLIYLTTFEVNFFDCLTFNFIR